jgi:hypothetical protein
MQPQQHKCQLQSQHKNIKTVQIQNNNNNNNNNDDKFREAEM